MKDIFDQFPELHQKPKIHLRLRLEKLTSHDVVIRLTTIPQGLSPF